MEDEQLSNTILKAHHAIPAKFGPVVSEKILNVIFYQNMDYFHNRYKSAEK